MKTIKFTSKELRALEYLITTNPCSSGCVYKEMERSKKDCDECEFTKHQQSIIDKVSNE